MVLRESTAIDSAVRYVAAIPPAVAGKRNEALNRAAYAVLERFDLSGAGDLPEEVPDGIRALLRACFKPGECVRIVPAIIPEEDDEGHEIPDGIGFVWTVEEWLKRLDARYGKSLWSFGDRRGVYMAINPLKEGAAKDEDVTAYRHALVEFDSVLTPEQQFELYRASNLPCAAVIYSGGKSVHAWVRVDAATREEYADRVGRLFGWLERCGYPVDKANRNPGRLSRMPNCVRFESRQQLLALGMGAGSWEEWESENLVDGIRERFEVSSLFDYEAETAGDSIVGKRWLCKGGSCIMVGPSGVGKSSLTMQTAISWALGQPLFGLAPVRPLRVLMVQAENDLGDVAEAFQGVAEAMGILWDEAAQAALAARLIIYRETVHTGMAFVQSVRRQIMRHKPDLAIMDPLLSFVGGDISKQEVCSQFLRNWLNPIAKETGVAWLCVHHTPKPPKEQSGRRGEVAASDFAYAGLGSSELTNWARAVVVLEPIAANPGNFRLRFPKRGGRSGACHPDGEPSQVLYLRHAANGQILWEQVLPPEEPAGGGWGKGKVKQPAQAEGGPVNKGGRPAGGKVATLAASNLSSFLAGCTADGEGSSEIARRLENWFAKVPADVNFKACQRVVSALVGNGKLAKGDDGKYRRGPNA